MSEAEQRIVVVNGIDVPVIKVEDTLYYPVSYFGEKVLLKGIAGNQLKKNGYGEYLQICDVNFEFTGGGIQPTYCISGIGMVNILKKSRINKLSKEQRIAMIEVCKYFKVNIDIPIVGDKFIDTFDEWINYDYWDKECIESYLSTFPDSKWRLCNKCNTYYPHDLWFFEIESNPKNRSNIKGICKKCNNSKGLNYYGDALLNKIYHEDGVEWYRFIKEHRHDIDSIYSHYLKNGLSYPSILKNNVIAGNIIVSNYKQEILDNLDDCNAEFISSITKIPEKYISIKRIDKSIVQATSKKKLLGSIKIDKKIEKIKLKGIVKGLKYMTFEEAKELIDEYIRTNNIIIEDVYTHDYESILKNSKTIHYINHSEKNGLLGFIMRYWNYEFAPYKFKITSRNYWENRDNVDFAMKYFIERDLKIPLEKIPLYVTKNNIARKARTLYYVLWKKRFDVGLFSWIDRIYPGKFIEEDFNVGIIRNEFDSMDEFMVHDMLTKMFKNVLYNTRKNENGITILGMQPDWFIFTDNDIYIVEYYGISPEHGQYNQRIKDYTNKTKEKIEKYKDLPYGKKIYIFPEDLKRNNEEFYKKMSVVV
jgi:hypothetical protein